MKLPTDDRPELAILPLGTANDFATGCAIPANLLAALQLAQSGETCAVDAGCANNVHFINVASGGFGAQLTTKTPVVPKNFLGGGAYTLSGLVQAVNFVPYQGILRIPGESMENEAVVGAVCNGRQAGGAKQLAPSALINLRPSPWKNWPKGPDF